VLENSVLTNVNRGFVFSVTQGGDVSDVLLSNLTIDCNRFDWFWAGDGEPFYFKITRQSEWNGQVPKPDEPLAGSIRNVMIQNVIAHGKGTWIIDGHPDSWLDGISFDNVKLFVSTDSAAPYDSAVHAVSCRWAKNLQIKDFEMAWDKPILDKWESALYFEDVNGLELDHFAGQSVRSDRGIPVVVFNKVADATIRNSRALDDTQVFLKVLGTESRDIYLQGNDFRRAKVPYWLEKDVRGETIKMLDSLAFSQ